MNTISRHHMLPFSCLAALVLFVTSVSFAQTEKALSARKLPAAVQAAFHKAYPAAKIKGASSEVEDGKTMYEVESVDGTINRDLLYLEDGSVIEIEETIALSALPDPVSKALKAEAGKGKVEKAEKLTKGETIQYEFVIASGKSKREVVIDPSGKIAKTTKQEAKEKDEKEKED